MMLKKAEGRVKNEETGRKPPVTWMLHLQAKASAFAWLRRDRVLLPRSATAVQNTDGLAAYNRVHRGVRVNPGKSNRIKVNQGAFLFVRAASAFAKAMARQAGMCFRGRKYVCAKSWESKAISLY